MRRSLQYSNIIDTSFSRQNRPSTKSYIRRSNFVAKDGDRKLNTKKMLKSLKGSMNLFGQSAANITVQEATQLSDEIRNGADEYRMRQTQTGMKR